MGDDEAAGPVGSDDGPNWFGKVMYAEKLAWLGLETVRVEHHRIQCAHLPPLSARVESFVAVDFTEPAAWPREEGSYRFYVLGWNLGVLPPGSKLARLIADGLAGWPDELRLPVEQHVGELAQRKRVMFPDDPRLIDACLPVVGEGAVRLRVAWTTPAGREDAAM